MLGPACFTLVVVMDEVPTHGASTWRINGPHRQNESDGEDSGQQGVDPEAGGGNTPGRGSGQGYEGAGAA